MKNHEGFPFFSFQPKSAQHSVHPTGGTAASQRARFQAVCVA